MSAGLQDELRSGLAPLLSTPEEKKDWHPGSDGKVLNLVHPSLFPLVYGRSEVLRQAARLIWRTYLQRGQVSGADARDAGGRRAHNRRPFT